MAERPKSALWERHTWIWWWTPTGIKWWGETDNVHLHSCVQVWEVKSLLTITLCCIKSSMSWSPHWSSEDWESWINNCTNTGASLSPLPFWWRTMRPKRKVKELSLVLLTQLCVFYLAVHQPNNRLRRREVVPPWPLAKVKRHFWRITYSTTPPATYRTNDLLQRITVCHLLCYK